MKITLSPDAPAAAGAPASAALTADQIVQLAADLVDGHNKFTAIVKAGKAALDAHNAAKGVKRVNTGSFQVIYGECLTIAEQLRRHIAENTPPAA